MVDKLLTPAFSGKLIFPIFTFENTTAPTTRQNHSPTTKCLKRKDLLLITTWVNNNNNVTRSAPTEPKDRTIVSWRRTTIKNKTSPIATKRQEKNTDKLEQKKHKSNLSTFCSAPDGFWRAEAVRWSRKSNKRRGKNTRWSKTRRNKTGKSRRGRSGSNVSVSVSVTHCNEDTIKLISGRQSC